jgi:transposase
VSKDGIRFRVRTGIPCRDVPEVYGPWGRAYDLFRRWQLNGTWQRIFTQLQAEADAKDLITWALNIDSTVYRAHQHAAGARKRGTFCTIPDKVDQARNRRKRGSRLGRPPKFGPEDYKARHAVECGINGRRSPTAGTVARASSPATAS